MRIPGFPDAHLTYCLNIHPGETFEENEAAIREHAARVKDLVSPREPFGLGLRLGRRATDALADPARLRALGRLLADGGMYAFTVNGFPYGAFHGTAVKSGVYRPDWRQPERLAYTCRIGELLAALLPEGLEGSISTVPVSYREWMREAHDGRLAAENLAACAAALHELRNRTGREIHLGLEPEPDCTLETTEDAIASFERDLWPVGVAWLAGHGGYSRRTAEALLRRHVGVCFDACHFSVQFEQLDRSLETLTRHGIRVSKVQISAALKTRISGDTPRRLEAFVDPVYLHQAKILDAGGRLRRYPDLTPEFLRKWTVEADGCECRIHFHVPLYMMQHDGIASTADDLTPAFLLKAARLGVQHFEIETYTFDVLPLTLRRAAVESSIADEYGWVLERFAQAASENAGFRWIR